MLFIALAAMISCRSCHRSTDPGEVLIIPFRHLVIDANPFTGKDCCTDVLALGDINGDGRVDLVLGAQESKKAGLVWYENPGWSRHEIAQGEFTTDGKVADLDRDGDADIVIGDAKLGLLWFENSDRGRSWKTHVAGRGYVHDIEVGDVDRDDQLEIVTCDKRELKLWRRSGDQWATTILSTRPGEGLALVDLDGDKDQDILFGASWFENTGSGGQKWVEHVLDPRWPADTRVRAADMNHDGLVDVILTASEGTGTVAWLEHPKPPATEWGEHSISSIRTEGAHSLIVADLDGDGDLDLTVAEMHTSRRKRVINLINDGADRWRFQTLATSGSHNMQAADLDGDGDVDLVGKNYGGVGRTLDVWMNLGRDNFDGISPTTAPFVAPGWTYVSIDSERPRDQYGKMGLVVSDVNHDAHLDLIAGSFLYINPGADLAHSWKRVRIGDDVDVYFALNGLDGRAHLVGVRRSSLILFSATTADASNWSEKTIGVVPAGRTQGYISSSIEDDGAENLIYTRGNSLLYIRVPNDPENGQWTPVTISNEVEEEGVAAADVNQDGRIDLFATAKGGRDILWLENPGTRRGQWTSHRIGRITAQNVWLDRVLSADINQDGRSDVIVSEESQDWTYNSTVFWFEAPKYPASGWRRHEICTLRSANSADIHDMNGDGVPDVILAEHTDMRDSKGAPNNLTVIFENVGRGTSWAARPVEAGPHSSHLGARVFDFDGDGREEIVSLGWNQYRHLHLWWHRPNAR
jgi:hypothetical protein